MLLLESQLVLMCQKATGDSETARQIRLSVVTVGSVELFLACDTLI